MSHSGVSRIVHVYTSQRCIHYPWSLKKIYAQIAIYGDLSQLTSSFHEHASMAISFSNPRVSQKLHVFCSYEQNRCRCQTTCFSHINTLPTSQSACNKTHVLLLSGVLWVLLWSICRRALSCQMQKALSEQTSSTTNAGSPGWMNLTDSFSTQNFRTNAILKWDLPKKKSESKIATAAWNLGITFGGSNPIRTRIQETWAIFEIPSSWYMSPVCSDVCVCVCCMCSFE